MILAIIGASGVGKTATLKTLAQNLLPDSPVRIFHFDDIGMPNWDELEDTKKWQEETTLEWVDRLVKIALEEKVAVLFEGSTEARFLIKGFAQHNFTEYKVLLFDCSVETMKKRLSQRGQSEIFTQDMINWLHYLREDSEKRKVEIIQTDHATLEELGQTLLEKIHA